MGTKTLLLSYKRNKFFPSLINTLLNHTYITLSLGIFLRFFLKPKSFKKSKQLYLLSMLFFKKLILTCKVSYIYVFVKAVPKYFLEFINNLLSSEINLFKNPFTNSATNITNNGVPTHRF